MQISEKENTLFFYFGYLCCLWRNLTTACFKCKKQTNKQKTADTEDTVLPWPNVFLWDSSQIQTSMAGMDLRAAECLRVHSALPRLICLKDIQCLKRQIKMFICDGKYSCPIETFMNNIRKNEKPKTFIKEVFILFYYEAKNTSMLHTSVKQYNFQPFCYKL